MVNLLCELPRELLYAITDILNEDDRPALKAFSTTCRAVRPYALSHLFYHLHFGRLLYSNERIDKFLEFCKQRKHIPGIYRKLTLSLGYVDNTRSAVLSIRLLTNIDTLRLTQLSPTNISPYLQDAFRGMPVRSLTCEDMKISNKVAFVQFIAQCLPRVVQLALLDIGSAGSVGKSAARASLINNPLRHIQTVTMVMSTSPFAFDVRMLELPCMRDVTIVCSRLAQKSLRLASLTYIVSLTIPEICLPWLVGCLQTSSAPVLERITVQLAQPKPEGALDAWKALDEIASTREGVPSLHSVMLKQQTMRQVELQGICTSMQEHSILKCIP